MEWWFANLPGVREHYLLMICIFWVLYGLFVSTILCRFRSRTHLIQGSCLGVALSYLPTGCEIIRKEMIFFRFLLIEWCFHDDVIKWKHFPRYWPFVGIHRSTVNSLHKGQWRGVLMFSLICVWINGWVNNREAGDLRRYRAHYDVSVMTYCIRNIVCLDSFTVSLHNPGGKILPAVGVVQGGCHWPLKNGGNYH